MNFKLLIFTFILFQSIANYGQSTEVTEVGEQKTETYCLSNKTITLNSQILNEKREIKVLLPDNYADTNNYPTLYITDADHNFETAASYVNQLMKINSVPECILVGINQKNRGIELDIFMTENGIKFKDFIFKELVPYIKTSYSTSGFNAIIGHSDGAEYNHLLMLEKDCPFRGFINMSTNLNNDVSAAISEYFKSYDTKNLYYFIANAEYDSPDRIEAGKSIDNSFQKNENPKIKFLNKLYKADHQTLVSRSLIDGLSFIFQDYRNLDEYQNFKEYVQNYRKTIERDYGFTPKLNDDDMDYFYGETLDNKDVAMYEYMVNYVTENNIFEIKDYDKAWQYFAIDQYPQSLKYWNKTIEKFEGTSPRVFYSNFTRAIDAYLYLKNPTGAIQFLEKCKKTMPQYTLEFNYFIAKVALENQVEEKTGRRSLKYCKQHFKENKYFGRKDLIKLEQ